MLGLELTKPSTMPSYCVRVERLILLADNFKGGDLLTFISGVKVSFTKLNSLGETITLYLLLIIVGSYSFLRLLILLSDLEKVTLVATSQCCSRLFSLSYSFSLIIFSPVYS